MIKENIYGQKNFAGTKGRARLVITDYFHVYSQSDERSKVKVKEVGYITKI